MNREGHSFHFHSYINIQAAKLNLTETVKNNLQINAFPLSRLYFAQTFARKHSKLQLLFPAAATYIYLHIIFATFY